jgi:hypothetical protein
MKPLKSLVDPGKEHGRNIVKIIYRKQQIVRPPVKNR